MSAKWLHRLLAPSRAHCEDLPLEEQLEDQLSMEEEEQLEERSHHIPSFLHLLQPLKTLTTSHPGQDVEGFRFSLGLPLSNNFLSQHTINLSSKKAAAGGPQMFDFFNEKTPFYNLGLQYHHGDLVSRRPHIAFSLMGTYDANGRLNAMFAKNLGNFRTRLQSSFVNSNVAMSQTNLEVEHQGAHTKQTCTLSSQLLNYSLVERLGRSLLLGFDLYYLTMQNAWTNGLAMRYALSPTQRLYFQYSGMARSLTFGTLFKLNESTTLVTELEYGGPASSEAVLGYRTKGKSYQVDTLCRTNGDLKSVFTYTQNETMKLKLFLSGNLHKEEFKSGFALAIGPTDD